MARSIRGWYTQWWPPAPTFTDTDVPLQLGRVFMVTGGNSGVGFELCKILYATGGTIYMASRSKDLAKQAISAIITTTPTPKTPGQLKFLSLDLSDLNSVKAAAASFAMQETHLDVLWNNAGLGSYAVPPSERTVQGLEPMVGVNCVGPLLLTTLLLPQLKAAAKASARGFLDAKCQRGIGVRVNPGRVRVVWTTSWLVDGNAPNGGIDMAALERGGFNDGMTNYAMSKCGNWALGVEMARRHGAGEDGIVSVVQNPGNLQTRAQRGAPWTLMTVVNWILHEPKYGAYTELFAGLAPEIADQKNGSYVFPWGRVWPEDCMPRSDIVEALKPAQGGGHGLGEKFWDWCEKQWREAI